jgi:ankyrin repeat protein
MVKLLLANGAAIEDDLWYAAREGQKAVVELLLARGAAVHASDNRGRTALTMARLNGHKDVEELLRRHGGRDWPDLG